MRTRLSTSVYATHHLRSLTCRPRPLICLTGFDASLMVLKQCSLRTRELHPFKSGAAVRRAVGRAACRSGAWVLRR